MSDNPARLRSTDWAESREFVPLNPRKIIGINNLMSIAWLNRGLQISEAVGRVMTLGGPGSGFLIAPDLFITNHHVIPDELVAEKADIEFNYQENWEGAMEAVHRYTLDRSFFRTVPELDYTIVRVKERPGDRFGYIDINRYGTPRVNDYVSIIQHPHGGPKQICLTDNKVSAVFGDYMQYATDTEPGSSGSPVFNQQWEVVGLHHKGGGLVGPDGQEHFTNQGVLISSILRDAASFLGIPDTLYSLAFGELRSSLIESIGQVQSAETITTLERELFRRHPQLSRKLGEWSGLNCSAATSINSCLCNAGIAIGASLRHWARHEGREAIPAAAMNDPEPSPALYELAGRFRAKEMLPTDVHSGMLSALKSAGIGEQMIRAAGTAISSPEQSFLLGVSLGAAAIEGPTDARSVTRVGR